jgi:hypothetical protein
MMRKWARPNQIKDNGWGENSDPEAEAEARKSLNIWKRFALFESKLKQF